MHILIMNWRDPKHPRAGGAEIVTCEHAKRWVKMGHTVTWLCAWSSGLSREETIEGVHFVRRGGSMTIYFVAPFYYLKHESEFTVIVDEIHGLPFFTPLYTRKPKVAFIHEIAKEIWQYMTPFPINILGRLIEQVYFRVYKHVPFWTDAASTASELEAEGIPKKNCTVIPCPITNKIVTGIPKKESKPTFLYMSRVVKFKGIEEVLNAFALVQKQFPDAQFWVAGDGFVKYMQYVKRLAQNLGIGPNITFFGKVSERKKLTLMQKAHLLLHASVREGWGLVVLEAASQGTPAVVYDVPGLRDTVHHMKTGIVTKGNSPEMLAEEAVSLYKNKTRYARFQKNALMWVKSLSWDTVAKESASLLEQVSS